MEIVVEAEETGTVDNTASVRANDTRVDADTERTLVEARNNDDDDDNDNDNDSDTDNDTDTNTDTNTDTTDTTTTAQNETTTAETTTADDALNADVNRPDAENFQCELFLRVVRDDRGALRAQYQGNELIVQRVEQCLAADVLADTIPDRRLPFTGGMPLLGLVAIGGVALVVGSSVLRAVTRRGR